MSGLVNYGSDELNEQFTRRGTGLLQGINYVFRSKSLGELSGLPG